MVHIVTQNFIDDMLKNPHRYITSDKDEVILKVEDGTSSPAILMLGYDDEKMSYYFVIEDNEVSEDIYCETEKIPKMFNAIMDKLLEEVV